MKRIRFFSLLAVVMLLSGCMPGVTASTPTLAALTSLPTLPVSSPTARPTLALENTSSELYEIPDFASVHSAVDGDSNEHLIFGNLPRIQPAADTPSDLSVFLGRWEGYSYVPPVEKDRKLVMHVAEISEKGGTLYAWTGTNIQFPDQIIKVHFRVTRENGNPAIEFQMTGLDNRRLTGKFNFNAETKELQGDMLYAGTNQVKDAYRLTQGRSFYVYKDYAGYLAGKNITTHAFRSRNAALYSKGYMLYLPDGYDADPQKQWPLIFFLHGTGDRGDNILLLAKASPFMYIRQEGPLPAIIAAPLLTANPTYSLFPEQFLNSSLDEILADYRIDRQRIYLTGLSLGGEASYRLAMLRPKDIAAVAPLCAFIYRTDIEDMKKIKDIPVWAIHGANDAAVRLELGQKAVDTLKAAGGNVKFSILPEHDHDVWTDTYSDPAFYDWLLAQQKTTP